MTGLQNKLLATAIMQCWHYSENDLICNTGTPDYFSTVDVLQVSGLPTYVYKAGIEKLKTMDTEPVKINKFLFDLLTKGCEFPKIHRTPHIHSSVYKNHGLIIESVNLCEEKECIYIISTDKEPQQ